MLWQQLERVSVAWPDYGEVAAVKRCDPDRAVPLGQGDHGRVRPAEPQVSVGANQILDALPVGDDKTGYFQLTLDDGRVQGRFCLCAKLAVDQVSSFRDDHGCSDQGAFIALQQLPAGNMVLIGTISRRDQRAGIDNQHLIASEPLGQHFIGFGRSAPGSGSAYGSESQPTARCFRQLRHQKGLCQLVRSLATTSCLRSQRLRDGVIQMQRHCHDPSVQPCTLPGITAATIGRQP